VRFATGTADPDSSSTRPGARLMRIDRAPRAGELSASRHAGCARGLFAAKETSRAVTRGRTHRRMDRYHVELVRSAAGDPWRFAGRGTFPTRRLCARGRAAGTARLERLDQRYAVRGRGRSTLIRAY